MTMQTEQQTYPVTEEERSAIHAATGRASNRITEEIPAEFWPTIREAIAAQRTQAALYGYVCESDEEFRAYIGR